MGKKRSLPPSAANSVAEERILGVTLGLTLGTPPNQLAPASSHVPSHVEEDKCLRLEPKIAPGLMCVTGDWTGKCAAEDTDTILEVSLLSSWNHSCFVL